MKVAYDISKTWSGLPAPQGWTQEERAEDGIKWRRLFGEAISVIESTVEKEGRTWLPVSVGKPNRKKMPTYEDLQAARNLFIGEDRECYMIFPTKDRYVNIYPVLHLWCCLDQPGGVLPRFEGMVVIDGKEQLSV